MSRFPGAMFTRFDARGGKRGGEKFDAGIEINGDAADLGERGRDFYYGDRGRADVCRATGLSQRNAPVWKGAETLARGEFVPYVSFADDGKTTAVVRESFAKPPEVWAGPVGDWKQITNVNAGVKPAWGEAKSLQWTTDIGAVQGWLIYPQDYDPAKKYPMVVYVHGGPAWAITPTFPTRWQYPFGLPEHGYFVLEPNPRGSYGQGEKFTRANVKDFGYGDFRDIMAGVDEAIKQAPVDPARLGITGWSYGGFMTMWAVTQTNRFGAAVAGAGLSNYTSYYGENKIDQWMIPYFGATVMTIRQCMRRARRLISSRRRRRRR